MKRSLVRGFSRTCTPSNASAGCGLTACGRLPVSNCKWHDLNARQRGQPDVGFAMSRTSSWQCVYREKSCAQPVSPRLQRLHPERPLRAVSLLLLFAPAVGAVWTGPARPSLKRGARTETTHPEDSNIPVTHTDLCARTEIPGALFTRKRAICGLAGLPASPHRENLRYEKLNGRHCAYPGESVESG